MTPQQSRPIRVNVLGHGIVEFPAGTSDAEMEMALSQLDGQKSATAPSRTVPGQLWDQTTRMVGGGAELVKNLVTHPVDTAVGLATMPYQLIKGHADLGVEMGEDFKAGNYGQATVNGLLSIIPVLGPIIKSGIEEFQAGRGAEWAGQQSAGMALGRIGVGRGTQPRPVARPVPVNDAAQIARYGMEHGVDPRLGDAVGGIKGSALKRLDQLSQNTTLAGAKLTGDQAMRRSQGLATLGEQIEARSGRASAGRAEAGRQTQQRVSRDVTQLADESTAEYQTLQNLEYAMTRERQLGSGQVEVPPAFPVNFEQFRNDPGVRRLHGSIQRTSPVSLPNAAAQSAFQSLDDLLNSDAVMSLSEADMVLSGFKDAQRRIRAGGSVPGTRSPQVIDSIVSRLSAIVDNTAKQAGPEVVAALKQGRELWKEKIAMQDFLKQLDGEPAAIIGKITKQDDGGINFVNSIQRFAPEQVDVLSQSILSKMVQGVIDPRLRDASLSAWQRLGPETKLALFKDAAHVAELDTFFHLSKQVKADLNPSGSGYTAGMAGHVGSMAGGVEGFAWGMGAEGAAVLNAALNSPAAVRAIVRYMQSPPSRVRVAGQQMRNEAGMLRQNALTAIQQAVQQWQRSVTPSRAQGAGAVQTSKIGER